MKRGTRMIIQAALAADETVSPAERRRWAAAMDAARPDEASRPIALSHEEAARLLGCSTRTLRRRVADGTVRRLPAPAGARRQLWVETASVYALSEREAH